MAGEIQDPFLGKTIAGRYEITKKLAQGGMGRVYIAMDPNLEREVVFKVPVNQYLDDGSALKRFKREIDGIRSIEHPQVVPIFDAGEIQGVPWFIQRYMRGGSLSSRIPHEADPKALGWLRQVASALDYCHAVGLVHRDIKPSNILFDDHRLAYISDFGVALWMNKGDQTRLTQSGLMPGSPAYMAPEQALSADTDGRADQYALAVCAYEALSGRLPFEGESSVRIAIDKSKGAFPPLHEVMDDLDPAVGAVVGRALSPRPEHRYGCCEDFSDALIEGLQGHKAALRGTAPTKQRPGRRTTTASLPAVEPGPRRKIPASLLIAFFGVVLLCVAILGTDYLRKRAVEASRPQKAGALAPAMVPVVRLTEPAEGAVVRRLPLRVKGMIEAKVGDMKVRVGRETTALKPGTREFEVALKDLPQGPQKIRIFGLYDALGREQRTELVERMVTVDLPPREGVLQCELAPSGFVAERGILRIEGRLVGEERAFKSVAINGTAASLRDGRIGVQLPLAPDAHTDLELTIEAFDRQGHPHVARRTIRLQPSVSVCPGRPLQAEEIVAQDGKIRPRVAFQHVPRGQIRYFAVDVNSETRRLLLGVESVDPGRGSRRVPLEIPEEGRFRIAAQLFDTTNGVIEDVDYESTCEVVVDRTGPEVLGTPSIEPIMGLHESFRVRVRATDGVSRALRLVAGDVQKRFAAGGATQMILSAEMVPLLHLVDDYGNETKLALEPPARSAGRRSRTHTNTAVDQVPDKIASLRGDSSFTLQAPVVGGDFTLEGWFQPFRPLEPGLDPDAALFAEKMGAFRVLMRSREDRSFDVLAKVRNAAGEQQELTPVRLKGKMGAGRWSHVALTRKGRTYLLHMDGELLARANVDVPPTGWSKAWIGAFVEDKNEGPEPRYLQGFLRGQVRALRLSEGARYTTPTIAPADQLPHDAETLGRFDFDRHEFFEVLSEGQAELYAAGTPWLVPPDFPPAKRPESAFLLCHEECELAWALPRTSPPLRETIRWNVHLRLGPLPQEGRHVLVTFPYGAILWEAPTLSIFVGLAEHWTEVGTVTLPKQDQESWNDYTISARREARHDYWISKAKVFVGERSRLVQSDRSRMFAHPWPEAFPRLDRVVVAPVPHRREPIGRPLAVGAFHLEAGPESIELWQLKGRYTKRAYSVVRWDARDGLPTRGVRSPDTDEKSPTLPPPRMPNGFIIPVEKLGW